MSGGQIDRRYTLYTFLILFGLVWVVSFHIILDIRLLGNYFEQGTPVSQMSYIIFFSSLGTLFFVVLRFAENRWSMIAFLAIIIGLTVFGWLGALGGQYINFPEVLDLAIYSLIFSAAFTVSAILTGNYLLPWLYKYTFRSRRRYQ